MATDLTSENLIALVDTVSMQALPPTFASVEHAADFQRYLAEQGLEPARALLPAALIAAWHEWTLARVDPISGELLAIPEPVET